MHAALLALAVVFASQTDPSDTPPAADAAPADAGPASTSDAAPASPSSPSPSPSPGTAPASPSPSPGVAPASTSPSPPSPPPGVAPASTSPPLPPLPGVAPASTASPSPLPGVAPASPSSPSPGAPPVAGTPSASSPRLPEAGTAPCLSLLRAGKQTQASTCFTQAKRADLAGLVSTLKLPEPELQLNNTLDLGELVLSGKAELVATSTLAGGAVAFLGATAVYQGPLGAFESAPDVAVLLLSPVAGGFIGLATSTAAVALVPQLTAGDANEIRAFEMLGGFNAIMFTIDRQIVIQNQNEEGPTFDYRANAATIALVDGGLIVASTAAGVGVAALTDLPEGAGSLALSSALWSSVGAVLAVDAFQGFTTHPENAAFLITATGNVGFLAGLAASPFVDVTRGETWAVDLGGGVGLAGGAAIATFAHAPNPFIGWGTIFLGTAAGVAGGYAAAHFIPPALEHMPALVAVAPTDDGRGLVVAASGRF